MSSASDKPRCRQAERVTEYALLALSAAEVSVMEAHLATCSDCRQELESLGPILDTFAAWPTDVLRPSKSLWNRLAHRIAAESGCAPVLDTTRRWKEPEWEDVAPGISCKLLATDTKNDR
ncbi:MAG: hypothetical protein JWN85_2324, partial [Gammaproteobacteria bacterium]|nr:hypothetical protein [Gammaproteobacteria bacterium]